MEAFKEAEACGKMPTGNNTQRQETETDNSSSNNGTNSNNDNDENVKTMTETNENNNNNKNNGNNNKIYAEEQRYKFTKMRNKLGEENFSQKTLCNHSYLNYISERFTSP